ncbi:hypothetical protein Q9966_004541 [Columba livia]|nr:hypothetical protein Q9966_004541 [Columba livia]
MPLETGSGKLPVSDYSQDIYDMMEQTEKLLAQAGQLISHILRPVTQVEKSISVSIVHGKEMFSTVWNRRSQVFVRGTQGMSLGYQDRNEVVMSRAFRESHFSSPDSLFLGMNDGCAAAGCKVTISIQRSVGHLLRKTALCCTTNPKYHHHQLAMHVTSNQQKRLSASIEGEFRILFTLTDLKY